MAGDDELVGSVVMFVCSIFGKLGSPRHLYIVDTGFRLQVQRMGGFEDGGGARDLSELPPRMAQRAARAMAKYLAGRAAQFTTPGSRARVAAAIQLLGGATADRSAA